MVHRRARHQRGVVRHLEDRPGQPPEVVVQPGGKLCVPVRTGQAEHRHGPPDGVFVAGRPQGVQRPGRRLRRVLPHRGDHHDLVGGLDGRLPVGGAHVVPGVDDQHAVEPGERPVQRPERVGVDRGRGRGVLVRGEHVELRRPLRAHVVVQVTDAGGVRVGEPVEVGEQVDRRVPVPAPSGSPAERPPGLVVVPGEGVAAPVPAERRGDVQGRRRLVSAALRVDHHDRSRSVQAALDGGHGGPLLPLGNTRRERDGAAAQAPEGPPPAMLRRLGGRGSGRQQVGQGRQLRRHRRFWRVGDIGAAGRFGWRIGWRLGSLELGGGGPVGPAPGSARRWQRPARPRDRLQVGGCDGGSLEDRHPTRSGVDIRTVARLHLLGHGRIPQLPPRQLPPAPLGRTAVGLTSVHLLTPRARFPRGKAPRDPEPTPNGGVGARRTGPAVLLARPGPQPGSTLDRLPVLPRRRPPRCCTACRCSTVNRRRSRSSRAIRSSRVVRDAILSPPPRS